MFSYLQMTILQIWLVLRFSSHLDTEEQVYVSRSLPQNVFRLSEVGSEPHTESLVSLDKPIDIPPPV